MLVENLDHVEHVHLVLLKHSSHSVIAEYLTFVARVLKIVFFNVLPDTFGRLWTRYLSKSAGRSATQTACDLQWCHRQGISIDSEIH